MDDWDDSYDDETDDEVTTIPCPNCGVEFYDDSDQCPHCGEWITAETNPWSDRPTWWVALGVIGILATILALAI